MFSQRGTPKACIRTSLSAWLLEEFTDEGMASVTLIGTDGAEDIVLSSVYLEILLRAEKDLVVHLVK